MQQQQQNKKRQQQVLMRPSSNLDPESFHQFTMKTSLNCTKSFDGKIHYHKVIFILEWIKIKQIFQMFSFVNLLNNLSYHPKQFPLSQSDSLKTIFLLKYIWFNSVRCKRLISFWYNCMWYYSIQFNNVWYCFQLIIKFRSFSLKFSILISRTTTVTLQKLIKNYKTFMWNPETFNLI